MEIQKAAQNMTLSNQSKNDSQQQPAERDVPPFAKIEGVLPNSPAMEAGLMKGDLIITFGTIDYSNNRQLRALGEMVSNANLDGTGITLFVARSTEQSERKISLKLRPRQWSGRGLVGCTFSPIL
jgi:26S proteasome non-ATPase regulatory subunit 9